MTSNEFSIVAPSLPKQPGIYKYFDNNGTIIYVGKAKNIFKRVSSYFNKNQSSTKTVELVRNIKHIEYTIVNNERDAFFLEDTLIKENQPKYNISLKDGKSYPFIVIKKEPFSRVFLTRKKIKDGSEYLGPFISVLFVKDLLEFLKQNIPVRSCTLNLSPKNIAAGKFKVCLEYHLGNCKGPCAGLQSETSYQHGLQQIKEILKGNTSEVIKQFRAEINLLAQNLEFEKAAIVKQKIDHLQQYKLRSTVVNVKMQDADIFNIAMYDDVAFVNYMAVSHGAIIQTKTIEAERKLNEDINEILLLAIQRLRINFESSVKEIVVPTVIDYPDEEIIITVPKAGDKKKLLDLSLKNAQAALDEWKRKKALNLEVHHAKQKLSVLAELQQDLQLQELPTHIECFDNSHFQGSYYVSAMVCFKDGVASKKDYRKYNIKTVKGIDDFAAMKEAVYRRYKRLTEEKQSLPQLVIIDGGKGQLNAAMEAIDELKLLGKLTLVSLAKNEEEVFFSNDMESRKLDWKSNSLNLVRLIRDEVHSFVITFHRSQRSKGTFVNELENIKGIGKTTAVKLLQKYKSVSKIKLLSKEVLEKDFGKKTATILIDAFK